jgi:thioesterase domain-containing protein
MADQLGRTGLRPPYHLFGWSFGGKVALELARILGPDAEFVGMVDTWWSPSMRPLHHVDYLLNRLIMLSPLSGEDLRLIVRRDLGWQRVYRRVLSKRVRALLPHDRARTDFDVLEWAIYRSGWFNPPEPTRHRVTYFTTEGTIQRQQVDPVVDWARIFHGGFEAVRIPGDHFTIWEPEFIGRLAAALETASDATRRRAAPVHPGASALFCRPVPADVH